MLGFSLDLDIHCMLGFSLDLDLMGFGTQRRISDFHLFLWFYFVWKALGQRGSVD